MKLTDVQRAFIESYIAPVKAADPVAASRVMADGAENAAEAEGDWSEFQRAWDGATDTWRKAEQAVGAQIKAMQSAFRKSGSDDLLGIANMGLPALTGNTRTRVMASIFDVDRVKEKPDLKTLERAEKNLGAMASHLKSDSRVAACDNNPFGIKMSIAPTLCEAIEDMRGALRRGLNS